MAKAEIGIIGGSGLYNMAGLTEVREEKIETPFGEPSEVFVLGKLEGREVAFLARHGKGGGPWGVCRSHRCGSCGGVCQGL